MLYNEQHMKDYEAYIESILKNEHKDVRLFDSIYEYLYKSKCPPNHEYVVYMSAYNATAGLLRLCNMYLDLVDYSSLYEEINGSTSKTKWNSWSIFEMMDRITQKKDSLKDFLLQFSKYININASLKLTITHILNEHSSCPYQTIRYDSASQIFASKTELTYEDLTCYSTYPLYRTRSQYRTNSDYSYQSKTSARTSFSFGSTVHSRRASSRTASCSSCSSIDNYEENAQPFVLNKNYRLMLSSYRNRLTGDIDNQIVLSSSNYVPSIYLHIQTNRLSLYQYLYDHMPFVGLFKLPYYYKDLIQYITSFVCLSTWRWSLVVLGVSTISFCSHFVFDLWIYFVLQVLLLFLCDGHGRHLPCKDDSQGTCCISPSWISFCIYCFSKLLYRFCCILLIERSTSFLFLITMIITGYWLLPFLPFCRSRQRTIWCWTISFGMRLCTKYIHLLYLLLNAFLVICCIFKCCSFYLCLFCIY